MLILLWTGIFIAALGLLLKSADWFTAAAERIGRSIGLSSFLIGALITSIGTSLPELITSTIATLQGDPAMQSFAIDNVIGSNIANCLLVVGISAIVSRRLMLEKDIVDIDVPFMVISSGLFVIFIMDGSFSLWEALLSLVFFGFFLAYTLTSVSEDFENVETHNRIEPSTVLILIGSCVGIFLGGKFTVDALQTLSGLLGIASETLTMLLVAVGTSLPEIIVSVQASHRGQTGIALGNVFGSNIFNLLMVVPIPALLGTVTTSPTALAIGIPFFLLATIAFIFVMWDRKVPLLEGAALLVLYVAFVGKVAGML
ncbi:calcium/sodium antiporter [Candidatus Peribacteria bacterium]|nr:calcium/sodium antiporter [Candidatus Peribacteria bacterium]